MKSIFEFVKRAGLKSPLAPLFQRGGMNQRGIALLLVLSAISVLTIAIVEFVYNTQIQYRIAVNNKERLQAYYLAQSGLNLSRLMLRYSKEAQSMLDKAGEAGMDLKMEPLYRMMPLSSSLLRGIASGDSEAAGNQAPDTPPAEGEKSSSPTDPMKMVNFLDQEKAKEFLNFDGDFSTDITEEQTKYDLNAIASLESTSPAYDRRKKELLSILEHPTFKDLFKDQERDAADLVHALADWVDSNDQANEFDNVTRGSEDRLYSHVRYRPKNGKMLTLSEMRLVAGMNDHLFDALKPFVTVYGGGDKINVCLGEDDLLAGLIHDYLRNSGCTPNIDYKDEDTFKELVAEVRGACPDISAMSAALNSKLGLSDMEAVAKETPTGATAAEGEAVAGCAFQFKDLLTPDNNIFTLKSTGTVGDTEVGITEVIDSSGGSPDSWKIYYYRIE